MSYTVVWRASAEAKLAELWLASPARDEIAAAADEIDERLRQSANEQGESRWGTTRILIKSPLAVYFDVSEEDRQSSVWAVWLVRREPGQRR